MMGLSSFHLLLSVHSINWEAGGSRGWVLRESHGSYAVEPGLEFISVWFFSPSKYKLRGVEVRWKGGFRNLSSKTGLENGTHRM